MTETSGSQTTEEPAKEPASPPSPKTPERPDVPTKEPQSPEEPESPPEPEEPGTPEEPAPETKAELERIRSQRPRVHEAHVRQSDNKGPDTTATLEPLAHASPEMWLGTNGDPDVLVSIPNLGVDRIYLGIDDVDAEVNLHAKVLDLVELRVGAHVSVKKIELEIDNVRVQAMVKVRLEEVRQIVHDVVSLIDHHPEILTSLTGGLGRGLEGALARKTPAQMDAEGNQPSLATPTPSSPSSSQSADERSQPSTTDGNDDSRG